MPWVIESGRDYSDEDMKFALDAALAAVSGKTIELVDVPEETTNGLGRKWQIHLSFMFRNLQRRYGEKLDDLIRMAATAHNFSCHFEASLRLRTREWWPKDDQTADEMTTAEGSDLAYPCGTLLATYYGIFCRTNLLKDAGFEYIPPTGDVLMALGVDRIIHAARCVADDKEKALNLLADFASVNFQAAQGEAKLDSYIFQKTQRRNNSTKGGKVKNEPYKKLEAHTIKLYEEGIQEDPKKWNGGKNATAAAKDIGPQIIEISRKAGGQLFDTSTKPLEWLRAYIKAKNIK